MIEKLLVPFHGSSNEANNEVEKTFLSLKDIQNIMIHINDDRLHSGEDVEHFTIHLKDKVVHVPKRSEIPFQEDPHSKIQYIKIEEYLQSILDSE